MKTPSTVLITGASAGIGRALALEYARRGSPLSLTGRNKERLDKVAQEARALGATVTTAAIDVTDANALGEWIREVDRTQPLELVIANAGISALSPGGETPDDMRKIFEVNVGGVVNTVLPALEGMRRRQAGRIATVSSVASFASMPGIPAYGASKFAVRTWSEGLRLTLWDEGIRVCAVCPGFISTAMTEGVTSPMPLLMSADKAARIIARGLERMPARLVFPKRVYWMLRILSILPESTVRRIYSKFYSAPTQTEEE